MTERLTKKEKGFVKDFVETGNGTKSALNNYDTDDDNVAANIASVNLTKPKIQNAILSIAEQIPDSLLVEKHLELLNVPKKVRTYIKGDLTDEYEEIDSQAIKAGLDMAYKLKGSYASEKRTIDITGNVNVKDQQAIDLALKYENELKEQQK